MQNITDGILHLALIGELKGVNQEYLSYIDPVIIQPHDSLYQYLPSLESLGIFVSSWECYHKWLNSALASISPNDSYHLWP